MQERVATAFLSSACSRIVEQAVPDFRMASFPGGLDPAPGQAPGLAAPPGISRSPGPMGEAQPPGLWPAPGPAAGAAGAPGEPGREFDLQKAISGTIESQVQRLIEQARHDTEAKVKTELKQIRDAMMAIDSRLDQLLVQLDGLEPPKATEPPLDAEAVGQLLSRIEQQWGQEIRTLKQELHQTILAHNHNADLIKHHKDTIDALRERCSKFQNTNVKTSEIHQQLQRLDTRLKQQQKQRKLEPLFERLTALETRLHTARSAWGGYPGMPVPPGMPPPGMPPGMMMPGMAGGKGAGSKGGAAQAKAGGSEKAAYRCPTDEEVQAKLNKLSQSGAEASPGESAAADASKDADE